MPFDLIVLPPLFPYASCMRPFFQTPALDARPRLLIPSLGQAKFVAVTLDGWMLRRHGIRDL